MKLEDQEGYKNLTFARVSLLVYENSRSRGPSAPILFYLEYFWSENSNSIKKINDIYFIK